jgi:hypothetical protein
VNSHFLPPVQENDLIGQKRLKEVEEKAWRRSGQIHISDPRAEKLACALSRNGLRSALHFTVYQKAAEGYQTIQDRRLVDA